MEACNEELTLALPPLRRLRPLLLGAIDGALPADPQSMLLLIAAHQETQEALRNRLLAGRSSGSAAITLARLWQRALEVWVFTMRDELGELALLLVTASVASQVTPSSHTPSCAPRAIFSRASIAARLLSSAEAPVRQSGHLHAGLPTPSAPLLTWSARQSQIFGSRIRWGSGGSTTRRVE